VTQCKNLKIPFLDGSISHHLLNHSLILDGIFGFSFKGTIRAPYDEIISSLKSCKIPIASIDIPSGWDVELGNINGNGLQPSLLISLTYPKKCASKFTGKHYIGGRFLPDFIAKKYSIQSPNFPNADQFVDITAYLE
jgi:NAD(P)H-hydrate epimerase